MNQIKVTCKLITPLFMYGISEIPEIRASSIKGLLRYWWRNFNKYKHEDNLLQKENEIFGSTNGASLVKIRVNNNLQEAMKCNSIFASSKVSYLFHFLGAGKNKYKKHINENSKFEIIFTYKDKEIKEYLDALYYLQLFGGMGSRSRRGAGNFVITDTVGLEESEEYYTKKLKLDISRDSLDKIYIDEKFEKVVEVYKADNETYKEYENWKEALGFIDEKYKEIRYVKKEPYKDMYNRKSKAVFGLPIKGIDKRRMESPLIFKVLELKNKKYIPIIIKMLDNPLLKEEQYKKNGQNLVDIFLRSFKKIERCD